MPCFVYDIENARESMEAVFWSESKKFVVLRGNVDVWLMRKSQQKNV